MLENYIENSKSEIIAKTQQLIQIPSISIETNDPSAPFGEGPNKALNYMLDLGKSLGFKTKNVDNYCGYIEFGEGEELLGIIGHLDVVPEGDNWTFPPYLATVYDNKIYGRGAIDDKGPVIASLYAMKAVMDNLKIHKRVRLILGLNEEKSWKCINYYKEHEEHPTIGFSPDADFPCIYAEKGIISPYFISNYPQDLDTPIKIKSLDCNNNPLNVVPKFCSTVLEISTKDNITMENIINIIKSLIKENNFDIEIYQLSKTQLKLTSNGIQAHAAHPDLGVNAISRLLIILNKLFINYNIHIELFEFFNKYIADQYNGENLDINFEDESGKLTLNVGNISLKDNKLKFGLNIRVPVTVDLDIIKTKFGNLTNDYENIECKIAGIKQALYIPKDNYLVTTLCSIYNETTNSNLEPIAIGGATYARAFDNCVSFGVNLPGQKDMCHQVDEFISIDNLMLACKIYAKAIYKLTK